ncbi:MAG: patatin-like phospholipase family protein [bacterium]|nr:MAG: patatin-like phospholipase family protein [bacterium]
MDIRGNSRSRRKVGLALGSGSARGWAHIGVLRCLAEEKIHVDVIAGTSMGALVGASASLGKIDDLESFARHLDWRQIVSFLDVTFPVSGLIEGNKVSQFVRQHVRGRQVIEELPVPFSAVAADLLTGLEVILDRGDLIEAIRASASIPGIFTPVRRNASLLVDGGLVNPVPVSVARQMGAEYVIAVDLNHDLVGRTAEGSGARKEGGPAANDGEEEQPLKSVLKMVDELRSRVGLLDSRSFARVRNWTAREPAPNIFEVIMGSVNIMQARIASTRLAVDKPDMLIRPRLGHIPFMAFQRSGEAIAEGYRAARERMESREVRP